MKEKYSCPLATPPEVFRAERIRRMSAICFKIPQASPRNSGSVDEVRLQNLQWINTEAGWVVGTMGRNVIVFLHVRVCLKTCIT